MPQGLTLGERTCSTVPGFLLTDTNPKAAGIFCLLLCLASHPCRALRSTHWLSHSHTRIQTYTDEHMMDYKYSSQDWVNVQHSVHWGHNTHHAHFSPATEFSVSTHFTGEKKNLHICSSDAVYLGRPLHEYTAEPRLKHSNCCFLVTMHRTPIH